MFHTIYLVVWSKKINRGNKRCLTLINRNNKIIGRLDFPLIWFKLQLPGRVDDFYIYYRTEKIYATIGSIKCCPILGRNFRKN